MTGDVRLITDGVPMQKMVPHVARAASLLVLSRNAYRQLVDELGTDALAVRLVILQATQVAHPIGINLEKPDGSRETAFLAPAELECRSACRATSPGTTRS